MSKNALLIIITTSLGLCMTTYGYVNAPITNKSEIRSLYNCDTVLKIALPKYCADPSSAPEAKAQIANPYTYGGIGLFAIGCTYWVINGGRKSK